MTLFDGSFPFYPVSRTPFLFNTSWAVILSVFLTVLATFLLILPGIRGKGRFFWFLRVVLSLFTGAVILGVNFSQDWETGWVRANTSYKSFSRAVVNADVGLHVGLLGVNITLVGNPVNQINETINYNEHFAWHLGADYTHTYTDSLAKGLPSPILYMAEKFTQESPCGVHSQYRISGHYTSITLWLAFCTWLISNVLFSMPVLLYGGYAILLTAALLVCSLLFFSVARNAPLCTIRFGPAALQTVYGTSFWLTLATEYQKKLHHLLKELSASTQDQIHTDTPSEPRPALFYLLPKIHKPGNPGRPIISGIGTLTTGLSSYVDSLLKPCVTNILSYH